MHVYIETTDDVGRERVTRLLGYSLNGHHEHMEGMQLRVAVVHNALDTRLSRCRLRAILRHGQSIEVEEIQSTLDLAVNRALERCARTIRRRLGINAQRHCA